MGTVAATAGIYEHVHFELTSDADGYNCSPGVTGSPALVGDPLETLSPAADSTKPTIEDVLFRDGNQEGVAAATYRTDVIAGRNVIFGNVDVIVKAHDQFGAFNSRLGLHKVGFEVLNGPRSIPEQTLEHFTGTFISPPDSFRQFRNLGSYAGLAEVIYEYDNTAVSNQDLAGGVANDGFYIVTNKDRDDILQLTDRDRYWNTDLRNGAGVQWNDQDAAGSRARFGGEAYFPDGDYTLRLFAEDEKGATNRTTLDKPITIDNFRPFVRKIEIKTLSGVLQLFEEWVFDGLNFIRTKTPKPFGPGRYSVELTFSEPVVTPAASVDGLGALPTLESTDPPGQQQVFTTTLDLEAPTTIAEGEHALTVTAKDPVGNDLLAVGGDVTTIDPSTQLTRDTSGVLQGVGGDTVVHFGIKVSSPQLTVFAEGLPLFFNLEGTSPFTPTTTASTATISVHGDLGLSSVLLGGSYDSIEVLSPHGASLGSLPEGTHDVSILVGGMVEGSYSVTATNIASKSTSGDWHVQKLTLAVTNSVATYSEEKDELSANVTIEALATAGAEQIISFDIDQQQAITRYGVGPAIISTNAAGPGNFYLQLRDHEGKNEFQELTVQEVTLHVSSVMVVAGSESVSTTVFLRDSGAAPTEAGITNPGVLKVERDNAQGLINISTGLTQQGETFARLLVSTVVSYGEFSLTGDGALLASGVMTSTASPFSASARIISVNQQIEFILTMTAPPLTRVEPNDCIERDPDDNAYCIHAKRIVATAYAFPGVRAMHYNLTPPSLFDSIRVYPGPNQNISIGIGASIDGMSAFNFGLIQNAQLATMGSGPGYRNLLGQYGYVLNVSSPSFYSTPVGLTLGFDSSLLQPGDVVSLARLDPCQLKLFPASVTGNSARATVDGFGRFVVVAKDQTLPEQVDAGACHFVSGVAGVTATPTMRNPALRQTENVLASRGLKPIGTTCSMGPTGATFSPPGAMSVCYSVADLTAASLTDQDLKLYQYNAAGVQEPLADLTIDIGRGVVTGRVDHFSSEFGIFATTTPEPASDLTPPITSVSIDGHSASTASYFAISSTSTVALSALDPPFPGAPTSGIDHAFLLLDTSFISTSATPGSLYSTPFGLSLGTHTVAFYSRDIAGNFEDVRSATIFVAAAIPDTMPPRTTIQVIGSSAAAGGVIYGSTSTLFSFTIQDDLTILGDGLGGGATQTFYALDGGSFTRFTSDFKLSTEGVHSIAFYSIDRATNVETTKTGMVGLDQSSPVSVVVSSRALFAVNAVDPVVAGAASGVAEVRLLIDVDPASCAGVFGDGPVAGLGTCENSLYVGAFPLTNGPHTVWTSARDAIGNVEAFHSVALDVVDQQTNGGLGIGHDSFDSFWNVIHSQNDVSFARANSSGVIVASAALAGAAHGMPWSVFFDPGGRAYAVGSADGGTGLDVGIYKASEAGDAIESRLLFDSGFANDDFVFDAVAPGWITGGAQITGGGDVALALWRFEPGTPAVTLSTIQARTGFDFGTGLGIDSDGSVWIAGYSMAAGGGFDFALWHYASDGHTLLGGPIIRESFLAELNGGVTAKVYLTAGAVYVAAPKKNPAGSTDLAFMKFDKGTGLLAAESLWRSGDGEPAYPVAILAEAGDLLVAGGTGGAFTQAALWRFGFDGALIAATTVDAGGAKGAVFRGSELWLSVDGSSAPYRVTTESPASGALVDRKPPRTSLAAGSPSFASGGTTYVRDVTELGFAVADDKLALNDGLGVGATQTFYATDGGAFARSTAPFSLVVEGTHTVSFYSVDLEGNAEAPVAKTVGVDLTPPAAVLARSGTFYAIDAVDPVVSGAASGIGTVLFLVDVSPESCTGAVDTAAARGTCLNPIYGGPFTLSAGTHTVYFEPHDNVDNHGVLSSSAVTVGAPPAALAVVPSSGPIGIAFTISGEGFGTYGGANTRVKFGTAVAPLSVWNDTTISGTVPGVSSGAYAVTIERQNASSVTVTETGGFTVTTPSVTAVSSSSGPIGAAFTLSGVSFGAYGGSLTTVLVGGATAPLSVWNETTIIGTVPGSLTPGVYPLVVERRTADGGLARANTAYFEVTGLGLSALNPSTGPIGIPFTIAGQGFGAYAGANTRVKFGTSVAALSLWNDTTIRGTVPALATGTWSVVVERQQGADVSASNASSFTVTALVAGAVTPSSGPVGAPFTVSGTGFGPYGGANTRLLIGGAAAALSVWNDTTITGTVPTLSAGPQPLRIERVSGAGLQSSDTVYFDVVVPSVTAITPSSGPIGIAFTLAGTGFGPYNGANTYVLIGGATAALSVWNDTTITGTVPGTLTAGVKAVTVTRVGSGGGSVTTIAGTFQVTGMTIDAVSPGSGPIGSPFTLTGSQFGTYGGSNTRVKFGGVVASLSVWNDTTISGTVPALTTGTWDVVVERQQGASVALSNTSSFTVAALSPSDLAPTAGPIGTAFTITGSGFGPYAGANTRVLVGGTAAALSVWNDTTISGTIPGSSAPGAQPVWIERASGSGVQSSGTTYFTVTVPAVASLSPSSAPIGAPFTITGTSFGAYAGANTRVKFDGVSAPLSVWNDTTITGTVPGALPPGAVTLVVERAAGSGLVSSSTQSFLVLAPAIADISPSYGPAGTVVTLTGSGFGPYAGALTAVLVGGTTVPLSVWNDSTIRWTVPASLADGDYPVVVRRSPAGGAVESSSATFTVGAGYSSLSFGVSASLSLAATPDSHFEGDLRLSSATGGRVDTPAHAAVEIPPNAMDDDKEITLKRLRSDGLRSRAAEEIKMRAAGEPIEFGPEGTRFNTPVTIELPYDPALTADESRIAVHYYNPLRRAWEELPSEVDRTRHVVKAKTEHFSIYQPMGLAPTTAAQDEFYLRDQYAFPNPSRNGSLVTFRIQPGLAQTVEVRVYDVAGRKIHESSDFTFLGAFDDGNGKGAQNTYDHAWSVSGVGSGVYSYVIKASQAGQSPIVRTGKVGVIK